MPVERDGFGKLGSVGLEHLVKGAHSDGGDGLLVAFLPFPKWAHLLRYLVSRFDVFVFGNIRNDAEPGQLVLDDKLTRFRNVSKPESLREAFWIVTAFEDKSEVLNYGVGFANLEGGLKLLDLCVLAG